jgi:predicted transcriptional regulator
MFFYFKIKGVDVLEPLFKIDELDIWLHEADELKSLQILTEREWAIMNVCWRINNISVQDVIEELSNEEKKHYQTVKKQLEVLVNKGFLIRKRKSPLWLYSPKFNKRAVVAKEVKNLIENIASSSISQSYVDLIEMRSFRSDELKKIMETIINQILEEKKCP